MGETKEMKKIAILLIAFMVISVCFLSGCNEISNDDDDTNQSEVEPDNKSEGKDDNKYIDDYLFHPMEPIINNMSLAKMALENHEWAEASLFADSGKKEVEQLIFEIQQLDVSDKYEPLRFNQLQYLDNLKEALFCTEKGSAAGNNGDYDEALTYGNMAIDYLDESTEYLDIMTELYKEIFW